jgi:hypothetical protein
LAVAAGALATVVSARALAQEPAPSLQACLPYLFLVATLIVVLMLGPSLAVARGLVVALALCVAASVIADAMDLYAPVFWQSNWARARRPGGFLANRNSAGAYLAIALPICLAVLERGYGRVALPALGLALAFSRCRTAWIAATLGGAVVLAMAPRPGRRTRWAAAGLVLLGALAAGLLPLRLRWSGSAPYFDTAARILDLGAGSGAVRVQQHRATVGALSGHWLVGLGVGRWAAAAQAQDRSLRPNLVPTSDYMRVLSDGGLVALFILVGLFAQAGRTGWRHRRQSAEVLGLVVALATTCLADTPLYRVETLPLVLPLWVAASGE